MTTVLLTTDGSDFAADAMARAVGVLGPGHTYLATCVVPPPFPATANIGPMDSQPVVVDPTLEAEVAERDRATTAIELEAVVAGLGVECETVVEMGEPGTAICSLAERRDVDVVVVGSHGHGWLQRVLMGSVSTYVLHNAPCPVLVIRPPRD